ncbi:TNT domain-containing protein [Amycolatopsis sp. 195334CR]|uniref:TNT domain-containing protein n=1 Tax=Amycolatopsis sp. 195334CR TaxID=2814588 RepID=UPI001A8C55ED|nr:TNT domain-containing protein [Amycolatopsis sp. 195334CR]MBN6035613.1 TNT domain-containing protein [Amycolatopsis sp. 195334CR]
MRYRIDAAERPDSLYAVWHGGVFRAQRSTADGTVLLVAQPGEEAPADFDTEWNGRPAKVVPEAEAASTFSVQTHCLFADEIFRVAPQNGEALTLRWTGQDEDRARELGLTDFTTTAEPEEIEALWQERHDFIAADAPRPERGTGDANALLRGIGRTMLKVLPDGWERVGAQLRQVGGYAELEVRAVAGDLVVSLSPPAELGQLFSLLRSAMYQPSTGTWFEGTFTLDSTSNFDFDFDVDAEPHWRLAPGEGGRPGARAYQAELELFPRDRKHVPDWLAAKAGLPLDVVFRQAKVVDSHTEGEKPVVNRPPLPPDEVRRVLDYLYRSPVASGRPVPLPDVFSPHGRPDVPDAFHTDGTWIWPAAVPHYLRKYGVPPEPELVDHIRANLHRSPYVPDKLRHTAEAEVLGKPYPPQSEEDLPGPDQHARGERDGDGLPKLRAAEVLEVLHRRLAELGVPASRYRIGEPADGAWCLRRIGGRWEVARFEGGEPVDPVPFDHVQDAARHLVGTMVLYPALAREPEEAESGHPTDWPILPLRGEPPLNFFRAKRMVVLPAGTVVQRFGNEAGNLVHPEHVRFPETSLAFEREREQHIYVLHRPLRVLTGITVPWGALPGGAIAYLLPRPLGQHVETKAMEKVSA